MKIEVRLSKFNEINKYRASVNAVDLEDLVIIDDLNGNDVIVEADPKEIEEWKYIGLNNWDFIHIAVEGKSDDN